MPDALHEPRQVIAAAQREYTAVGALNAPLASTLGGACENTVAAIYKHAVGESFPYQQFQRHKPGVWVGSLGLGAYYSKDTNAFLTRLDSYSLDNARFPGTPAFSQYTAPASSGRSKELIDGTLRFVEETSRLMENENALSSIRAVVSGKE